MSVLRRSYRSPHRRRALSLTQRLLQRCRTSARACRGQSNPSALNAHRRGPASAPTSGLRPPLDESSYTESSIPARHGKAPRSWCGVVGRPSIGYFDRLGRFPRDRRDSVRIRRHPGGTAQIALDLATSGVLSLPGSYRPRGEHQPHAIRNHEQPVRPAEKFFWPVGIRRLPRAHHQHHRNDNHEAEPDH